LSPLLFIIFINDLVSTGDDKVKLYLFADNAKLIKDDVDKVHLQKATDSFVEWTDKWQMKFNTNKCKIISIHHRRYSDKGVLPLYVMDNKTLEVVDGIKDLGVYYDSLLLFNKQLVEKLIKHT